MSLEEAIDFEIEELLRHNKYDNNTDNDWTEFHYVHGYHSIQDPGDPHKRRNYKKEP